MTTAILTGLLLGLGGSLHCLGMCGPIALALPGAQGSLANQVVGRTLYNVGRIITYGILGAAIGGLSQWLAIAGWQRGLSIAAGVGILLALLLPKRYWLRLAALPGAAWLFHQFQVLWGRWFKRASWGALLLIGLLNGLLPCGLVYVALAAALQAGSWHHGMLFMVSFGVGTTPALLALALARSWLRPAATTALRKVVPAVAALLAVLFIVRGLGLGIPLLSPDLAKKEAACPHCAPVKP
jgi:sulfite exporter TauE/SafE